MSDYIHSGSNKMNKVEAYKNDNKLLLADKLGHAKVSSLKEQNLLNTIATVQQHSNKISQLEADANKVRGAYVYKGTVETEFDLPLNNNSVGDVYNTSSTGMNYAWNGESWDELGSNFSSSSSITTLSNPEPYQQVYNLNVTESATQEHMLITNENLGGYYKDICIMCVTPYAPSMNFGGDPTYRMSLYFGSESGYLIKFSDYDLNSNASASFFFFYQFLNDGGLIKGKQGKTQTTNNTFDANIDLINVFPTNSLNLDSNIAPKTIIINPSLPVNSQLIIYARNKINSNEG